MKNGKMFGICAIAVTLALLAAAAATTAVIDPFFHYHAPLECLEYPLDNQRYQNDGIVRHFDYDALITGTSLTENFKASEFDALFGTNSVKVTYSGGTYEEITSNVQQALEHNPGVRCVLYGLDEWFLFSGKNLILADGAYPTYLYDDEIFNDVQYLLNKDVLFSDALEVLRYTNLGGKTTSFDAYSSWDLPVGREHVLAGYTRKEPSQEESLLTPELETRLEEQLQHHLIRIARENPDTQFLYFFPPYSILNWDLHHLEGNLQRTVEGMAMASEILMAEPNIQVYSFYTDYDTITDLDNYTDVVHYGPHINSLILERISREEYRLTPENHAGHWQEVLEFYQNYDYDALFAQ